MCRGDEFFRSRRTLSAFTLYESAYDSVVERIIGLGQEIDLITLQKEAADKLPENQKQTHFQNHLNAC